MRERDFTGGHLAESMDVPVSSPGARHGNGQSINLLEGLLKCELDSGRGVLALPTEEVLPAIREKETVRHRLHAGINDGRLGARDRRNNR